MPFYEDQVFDLVALDMTSFAHTGAAELVFEVLKRQTPCSLEFRGTLSNRRCIDLEGPRKRGSGINLADDTQSLGDAVQICIDDEKKMGRRMPCLTLPFSNRIGMN